MGWGLSWAGISCQVGLWEPFESFRVSAQGKYWRLVDS
jgi:hypothetical protein